MGISKGLNEEFRRRQNSADGAHGLDLDFSIQVCSSGSWPFNQSATFLLPQQVSKGGGGAGEGADVWLVAGPRLTLRASCAV